MSSIFGAKVGNFDPGSCVFHKRTLVWWRDTLLKHNMLYSQTYKSAAFAGIILHLYSMLLTICAEKSSEYSCLIIAASSTDFQSRSFTIPLA